MKVMKLFKKDFYKNFNNENIDEEILDQKIKFCQREY